MDCLIYWLIVWLLMDWLIYSLTSFLIVFFGCFDMIVCLVGCSVWLVDKFEFVFEALEWIEVQNQFEYSLALNMVHGSSIGYIFYWFIGVLFNLSLNVLLDCEAVKLIFELDNSIDMFKSFLFSVVGWFFNHLLVGFLISWFCNWSIHRFEFDFETLERVKVQSPFKYPLTLDMEPFVDGSAWSGNDNSDEGQVGIHENVHRLINLSTFVGILNFTPVFFLQFLLTLLILLFSLDSRFCSLVSLTFPPFGGSAWWKVASPNVE